MMLSPDPALANRLLASLPAADYQRLRPQLELVPLSVGQVLYEANVPIAHIYFPINALVSLSNPTSGHAHTEFGLVGNEGMVGISALLGSPSTISRAVVQIADEAMRVDAQVLNDEFAKGGVLQKQILLYLHWFLTQIAQNVACRTHHRVDARLARWLLSIQDRLQRDNLRLTQKDIAELLGTRRATITEAAGQFQRLGMIRYTRGEITILDRPTLEQTACDCYDLLQREQHRLEALRQARVADGWDG